MEKYLPLFSEPFSLPPFSTLLSDTRSMGPITYYPKCRHLTWQKCSHLITLTLLMCDPIVHVPSAYVTCPMMPESESMVEKGARETLRLLIGGSSSQPSTLLMGVFLTVLNKDS
ncbi:FMN-dependent NADH-azoreductase 1 [Bienertia sinuspersici]